MQIDQKIATMENTLALTLNFDALLYSSMLDNNEIIQTQVNIPAFTSSLSWIKPNVESILSMFTQANLFI